MLWAPKKMFPKNEEKQLLLPDKFCQANIELPCVFLKRKFYTAKKK